MTREEALTLLASPEQHAKDARRFHLIDRKLGPPPWQNLPHQECRLDVALLPMTEEEKAELYVLKAEYRTLQVAAFPFSLQRVER